MFARAVSAVDNFPVRFGVDCGYGCVEKTSQNLYFDQTSRTVETQPCMMIEVGSSSIDSRDVW